jgi:glycosyltransferase involved in cell wall biosynthesis
VKCSVVIPILNEPEDQLIDVLTNLTTGLSPDDLEVVLVNDGSINSDGSPRYLNSYKFPPRLKQFLSFHENMRRYGVGYSLDRGVEQAQGETIVIMGSDIWVEPIHWMRDVLMTVSDSEIGCGCSIGREMGYQRYGAKILYTMSYDDLPKQSPLRKYPDFRDILEPKWLDKQSDEPYEIPCVYGAYYWLKREQYLRIGGWDTEEGNLWRGHRYWGNLETHLSLKARVYGLKCIMYPNIETYHSFGRIKEGDRANRADYKWWNKLFTAYTLLDDELCAEVVSHPRHSYPLSLAQSYVRKNWDTIQAVRAKNKLNGKLITR